MSKSKHTPGPWKIYYRRGRIQSIVGNDTYASLLSPLTEPNARLIAAAPDLLEALKETMFIVSRKSTEKERELVFKKSMEAIAKADGEK